MPEWLEKYLTDDKNNDMLQLVEDHAMMLCSSRKKWVRVDEKERKDSEMIVPIGTLTAMRGGVPHAGPKTLGPRVVIFSTLEPKTTIKGNGIYNQYNQYTSTNLTMTLINGVWAEEENPPPMEVRKYLLRRLFEAAQRDNVRCADKIAGSYPKLVEMFHAFKKAKTWSKANELIVEYLSNKPYLV